MVPDKVCTLLYELACESVDLAERAVTAAGNSSHREELQRFVSDSYIFKHATEALQSKQDAAILKACMLLENRYDEKKAEEFIRKMEESVQRCQKLFDLADASYHKASFLTEWKDGLDQFTGDLKRQREWTVSVQRAKCQINICYDR